MAKTRAAQKRAIAKELWDFAESGTDNPMSWATLNRKAKEEVDLDYRDVLRFWLKEADVEMEKRSLRDVNAKFIDGRQAIAERFFERSAQFGHARNPGWSYLIDNKADKATDYIFLADAAMKREFPLIESYDDLELLPVGSVVAEAGGWWTYQSDYSSAAVKNTPRTIEWSSDAHWCATDEIELPAVLVYVPTGISRNS